MAGERLVFRVHALQRMAERGISEPEVRHVLDVGEVIEEYPGDYPFPSRLVLGRRGERTLHVVVAEDHSGCTKIVITVYEPEAAKWQPGFRKRK
jgi:hypothetical protein